MDLCIMDKNANVVMLRLAVPPMDDVKSLTLMLSTSIPLQVGRKWERHIPLFVDALDSNHGLGVGNEVNVLVFRGRCALPHPSLQFLPTDLVVSALSHIWTSEVKSPAMKI